MPEDVQSRFTVYERPYANPGRCIVCGATQRPVVDFGVDIEWADAGFGRAYFCVTCITQAASKFPEPIQETHDDWVRKFESWKKEYADELRTRVIESLPGTAIPVHSIVNGVSEQTEPGNTTDSESDKSETSGISGEADEPVSLERPAGVPSISSGGLFDGVFDPRV